MSNSFITIKKIRDLEHEVITDVKKANNLISIKTYLKEDEAIDIRMASLNSLRRIFTHFLETGRLESVIKEDGDDKDKIREYKLWLTKQFYSFQETMCEFILSGNDDIQTPSIRTMIEFVKREYLLSAKGSQDNVRSTESWFGTRTYSSLMKSLFNSAEISAELLIILKDEIFIRPDCMFYTLLQLNDVLVETKSLIRKEEVKINFANGGNNNDQINNIGESIIKNSLDILRMINIPENDDEINKDDFLVDGNAIDDFDDDNFDNDSNDDDSDVEEQETKMKKKKRGMPIKVEEKKKKQKKLSRTEQLTHWQSYKKIFSKAWLTLLSMPLALDQHKLVLKHLPEYVMTNLENPLLLSDYLSSSYDKGDILSVLALESLFQLIVKYNLDYPNFFKSLHKLCTVEVFSAKYRSKFIKLLSASLQSTNIPAYLVASFIKRLSFLALHTPSPSCSYCVAQITWLLQKHPQCLSLLHRIVKNKSDVITVEYIFNEEVELEKNNAINSSLWELTLLKNHHLPGVVKLVTSIEEDPKSTLAGMGAIKINVNEYIDQSFADLMEDELKLVKNNSALAFKTPSKLFPIGDVINECFGM
jgi:U3 small nucleolar RNA-associated protein 19